jgi:hypothetical protein
MSELRQPHEIFGRDSFFKGDPGIVMRLGLPSRTQPFASAADEREQWDLPLSSCGISACDPQTAMWEVD